MGEVRDGNGRKQAAIQARVDAILEANKAVTARANEMAASLNVPSDRELLAMLSDRGLDPVRAKRMEAAFDQRDRTKARADRAEHRRAEVLRLSLQGKLVREIANELGIAYDYVVQLRASLGVPRRRISR